MLDKILSFIADTLKALTHDSGWVKMVLTDRFNGVNDYCMYRKKGNVVEVRFSATPKQDYTAQTMSNGIMLSPTTMPADIAPRDYIPRGVCAQTFNSFQFKIMGNGNIHINGVEILHKGYTIDGQITYTV